METVAESALGGQKERVLVPINHDGDVIVLDRPTMTIGRTRANDVRIKSKAISRHHATLVIGPDAVTVEDAGSTNGCLVNGQKIKQAALRDGDCLELGDLQYRLSTRHVQSSVANSVDALSQAQIIQVSPANLSDAARLQADLLPSS
jgi:pSer/pThr/pTyr-binding forkhead associated (FHA) protein